MRKFIKKYQTLRKTKKVIADSLIYAKWSSKTNLNFPQDIIEIQKSFKEKGIIKLDANYSEFSNYILENYVNTKHFPYEITDKSNASNGTTIRYYLSLADPKIPQFILNPQIMQVIHCYYGTIPYLRNDPVLQKIDANDNTLSITNGKFHVDRFNQISLMLLLSDVNQEVTHMEYLCGTHKRSFWNLRLGDEMINNISSSGNHENFSIVGHKGDAFLFDSMGIHRAKFVSNSTRIIFHLNFTNGHNLYQYLHKLEADSNDIYFESLNRSDGHLVFTQEPHHTYFKNKVFDVSRW